MSTPPTRTDVPTVLGGNGPYLRSVIRRALPAGHRRDSSVVDLVMQQAALKALEASPALLPGSSEETRGWVAKIARRAAYDWTREREREKGNHPAGRTSPKRGQLESMVRRETALQMQRAIACLDDDRRLIVWLRSMGRMSWEEIAHLALSRSPDAARASYRRGVRDLRQALRG